MTHSEQITVQEFVDALSKFTPTALVESFEGSDAGVRVEAADGWWGWISTNRNPDGSIHVIPLTRYPEK